MQIDTAAENLPTCLRKMLCSFSNSTRGVLSMPPSVSNAHCKQQNIFSCSVPLKHSSQWQLCFSKQQPYVSCLLSLLHYNCTFAFFFLSSQQFGSWTSTDPDLRHTDLFFLLHQTSAPSLASSKVLSLIYERYALLSNLDNFLGLAAWLGSSASQCRSFRPSKKSICLPAC